MGRKVVSPCDGADILQAMVAFTEDASCKVVVSVDVGEVPDHLWVTVRAYTDHGARLGVAKECAAWTPNGLPLLSVIIAALHRAYWRATGLATGGATTPTNPPWAR